MQYTHNTMLGRVLAVERAFLFEQFNLQATGIYGGLHRIVLNAPIQGNF